MFIQRHMLVILRQPEQRTRILVQCNQWTWTNKNTKRGVEPFEQKHKPFPFTLQIICHLFLQSALLLWLLSCSASLEILFSTTLNFQANKTILLCLHKWKAAAHIRINLFRISRVSMVSVCISHILMRNLRHYIHLLWKTLCSSQSVERALIKPRAKQEVRHQQWKGLRESGEFQNKCSSV